MYIMLIHIHTTESINYINPKPEAVAQECSKGANKGLRVYKIRRLQGTRV